MADRVFIVLEGPDMPHYGTAEIHGVYATREEAEKRAKEVKPEWTPETESWIIPLGVEEWQIGEGGNS